MLDVAENMLLMSHKKNPVCLHFTTGLKFNIFGIISSNIKTQYVLGCPEGHWPSDKTADEVECMFF